MKGLKIKLAASFFTILATCNIAKASLPLPSGWYLEANIGKSKVSDENYAPGSLSYSGRAWNINGGYKFTPFFAGEIGYTKYANVTSKINGFKIATATNYSYDITSKAILPIGDMGLELFAKLGIARANSNVKNSNPLSGIAVATGSHFATSYFYGLGADYSFIPALAVNGQWQYARGNSKTGHLSLYSIGLSYLFG